MADLHERLASLRVDMPDRSAAIHIASIQDELIDPGPATRIRPATSVRRLLLVVAATMALLIPAAAFAADDAVPGDVLYPVKVAFEQVRSVFDSDIETRHRVEEAETMIENEANPDLVRERLRIAEEGSGDVAPDIQRRIDTVRDRLDSAQEPASGVEPDRQHDREQDQADTSEPGAESDGQRKQTGTTTAPRGGDSVDRDEPGDGSQGSGAEDGRSSNTEPPRGSDR